MIWHLNSIRMTSNEHHIVLNHQQLDYFFPQFTNKKHKSVALLILHQGNPSLGSLHKRPIIRNTFPCHYVIRLLKEDVCVISRRMLSRNEHRISTGRHENAICFNDGYICDILNESYLIFFRLKSFGTTENNRHYINDSVKCMTYQYLN